MYTMRHVHSFALLCHGTIMPVSQMLNVQGLNWNIKISFEHCMYITKWKFENYSWNWILQCETNEEWAFVCELSCSAN